jgi:mannose-6-phosphate isomerase
MSARPHQLAPNVVEHFYQGGERIAALRGQPVAAAAAQPDGVLRRPEEWLASTVARWGTDRIGLAALDGLGPLHELIRAEPLAWLGSAHVARWGTSPALLVKLLDAGQRLPVHVHPNRRFATEHLGCPFGKTEAWVVLDTPSGGGTAFVGTHRPVRRDEWAELVEAQATEAMLDLLSPVRVDVGDGVVVPASTPHCIDAGVFVVELQEPTDFSVLLEWEGFDVDGPADGHLGLGFGTALEAVRTDAVTGAELDALVLRAAPLDHSARRGPRALLPGVADAYFRAWAIDGAGQSMTVPPAFAVVVVTGGGGTLHWADGSSPITSGDAFVVPHAAGPLTFDGNVTAVVAQPPAADAPEPDEPDAP